MTKFDEIYEVALDNYGLITAAEAGELGVGDKDLAVYSRRGWLDRRGHGVYRITRYIPNRLDHYAEAVAFVGPGSAVWGESVLAMGELALVNPGKVTIATPRRVRKKLPSWIKMVCMPKGSRVGWFEGIACQPVADAILACKGIVMRDRLVQALADAEASGLVTTTEAKMLKRELCL